MVMGFKSLFLLQTDIFLGSTVICRRPEYFDEPDIFKPERWLRKQKDDITAENTNRMSLSHRFAVLPFGYGPRMCIGRRFAEQEVWLGLIKVRLRTNTYTLLYNTHANIRVTFDMVILTWQMVLFYKS